MPIGEQPEALLLEHRADVAGDNPFQSRPRLQRSSWRQAHELPPGEHRGSPTGSRLSSNDARLQLVAVAGLLAPLRVITLGLSVVPLRAAWRVDQHG